jgi:type II secretory pathway pseudopilin PulG
MGPELHPYAPLRRPAGHNARCAGISLIEVVVGLTILIVAASTILFALSQINRAASVARLYTAGQYIVQKQIDLMETDSPFNPQISQIPTELTSGTTTTVVDPIYVDPATTNTVVSGTLTSTVTNISNTAESEYMYQATVKLDYTYRSKLYEIIECTVRGSDQ